MWGQFKRKLELLESQNSFNWNFLFENSLLIHSYSTSGVIFCPKLSKISTKKIYFPFSSSIHWKSV